VKQENPADGLEATNEEKSAETENGFSTKADHRGQGREITSENHQDVAEGITERLYLAGADGREDQVHRRSADAAEVHDGAGSATDNEVNTQRTGSMPAESGKGRISEKGNRQTCGQNCEVYSRVVGYYRPVTQWNKGKQQEFKDRRVFVTRKTIPPKRETITPAGETKGE
jgi:hypothetical protein